MKEHNFQRNERCPSSMSLVQKVFLVYFSIIMRIFLPYHQNLYLSSYAIRNYVFPLLPSIFLFSIPSIPAPFIAVNSTVIFLFAVSIISLLASGFVHLQIANHGSRARLETTPSSLATGPSSAPWPWSASPRSASTHCTDCSCCDSALGQLQSAHELPGYLAQKGSIYLHYKERKN